MGIIVELIVHISVHTKDPPNPETNPLCTPSNDSHVQPENKSSKPDKTPSDAEIPCPQGRGDTHIRNSGIEVGKDGEHIEIVESVLRSCKDDASILAWLDEVKIESSREYTLPEF